MTCGSPPKPDKLADRPFHRDPPNAPVVIHPPLHPTSISFSMIQLLRDLRIIIHNHISWHILFSYKQFHKIVPESHGGPVMDAAYATHYEYQRPAFESPVSITHGNHNRYLGNGRWADATLLISNSSNPNFSKRILPSVSRNTFFPPAANLFPINDGGKQSAMLSRFITVLYHPLIHVGYGAEFTGCWESALKGRPELDFRKFYSGTEHLLYKVSGSPASGTLPNLLSDLAQTPNIWLSLIHPNPHLCYAQRALAHYSCLYGKQRKGSINTKLIKAGVEELDGTLFLRIAMLTQNRLGWMREGDPRSKLGF
ncbi:hypothetical protein J3A83DRAFT_4516649 [Scleroderma citrinum]